MKRKKILIVLLVFVINILLVYLLSYLIAYYKMDLREVYVARLNMDENQEIKEEFLELVKLPSSCISNDALISKEEIIGKYVKWNSFIPKSSLIYKDAVVNKEEIVFSKLNENQSNYDLFFKDVKCNPATLKKDIRIDLYCTLNKQVILSDLLIKNVRIVALYDRDYKEIKNNNYENLSIITLALENDMIPLLNKAIIVGDISIVVSSELYKNNNTLLNTNSSIYQYLK